MGRKQGSGEAGRRGSNPGRSEGPTGDSSKELREVLRPGAMPRFEIPGWREQYGVIAGITGRGSEIGRGFDFGLWSKEPVGEVMGRWLAFRREIAGFSTVALGNQVHGVEVMGLDTGCGWIQVEGVDGWTTTAPGILLTVTVADCVPLYLIAPGRGVALLHAGWRGTAGGILQRGLEQLRGRTGSAVSDIVLHCGVGICGNCYEVGSEVMQGCGAPTEGDGPWYLDLRDRLVQQAVGLGLTQVTVSPWCSAHDRSSFYSHRASRGSDGRMVAYLGIEALASNLLPE
jgi:polyphenol oxidase